MRLVDVVSAVTLLRNNCIIFQGRLAHKEVVEVATSVYSKIKMLNEVAQQKNNAVTK
jgi:hypothetical protein